MQEAVGRHGGPQALLSACQKNMGSSVDAEESIPEPHPIWCPATLAVAGVMGSLKEALKTKSEAELLAEYQEDYAL
jgi:hypothetical protein